MEGRSLWWQGRRNEPSKTRICNNGRICYMHGKFDVTSDVNIEKLECNIAMLSIDSSIIV